MPSVINSSPCAFVAFFFFFFFKSLKVLERHPQSCFTKLCIHVTRTTCTQSSHLKALVSTASGCPVKKWVRSKRYCREYVWEYLSIIFLKSITLQLLSNLNCFIIFLNEYEHSVIFIDWTDEETGWILSVFGTGTGSTPAFNPLRLVCVSSSRFFEKYLKL